jgi:hypothetical protein
LAPLPLPLALAPADFLSRLQDASGEAIQIDGLWALHFGNGTVSGTAGGDRSDSFFRLYGDRDRDVDLRDLGREGDRGNRRVLPCMAGS